MLRNPTSWGLRDRAVVLIIVLIVGTILAVAGAMNYLQYRSALADVQSNATVQASVLARTAEPSILLRDLRGIQHIVSAAMQEPDIRLVEILDGEGKLLVKQQAKEIFEPAIQVENRHLQSKKLRSGNVVATWTEQDLLVIAPVMAVNEAEMLDLEVLDQPMQTGVEPVAENEPVGFVCLWFGLERLRKQTLTLFQVTALIAGTVVAFASLITLSAVRKLVKPLNDLVRTTAAIAEGHRGSRAPQNSIGEVGKLARQINEMADRLEESYAHIEGKVTARTLELERERARLRAEVAERTRVQEALVLARDAAEAASQAKSEFLANISHEIRTPMNGIMGMTQLLCDTDLDQEQGEYLNTVVRCSDTLLRLLNDTLDFSKLDAGKMDLLCEPFDISRTVQDVGTMLAARAEAKGVALQCVLDERIPNQVVGDEVRFRQIVTNLVENAIKFTETGELGIQLDVLKSEGRDELLLQVRDTGIGIPRERQTAIFDSFTQVDGTTTRKYGGTGLGLSICRQLAELMGGAIWCESTPGVGSLFCVRIPLNAIDLPSESTPSTSAKITSRRPANPEISTRSPATEPTPVAPQATQSQPAPLQPETAPPVWQTKLRVLVIDDSVINHKAAAGLLRRLNCESESVFSGRVALERLAEQRFDIIFLDIQMPGMDGFETLSRIRKVAGYATTPVIAVTGRATPEDRDQCLAMGMNDFVTKPLSQTDVIEILDRWVGRDTQIDPDTNNAQPAASTPQVTPMMPKPEMPIDSSSPLNYDRALEALGHDEELLQEVLAAFAAHMPATMSRFNEAYKKSDWSALVMVAHSLKGASGHIGADQLSKLAAELEIAARSADADEIKPVFEQTMQEFDVVSRAPELVNVGVGASV